MKYRRLGRTGLMVPPVIFGTTSLGNQYEALPWETKLAIMREYFRNIAAPVVLDSAGKYGAGLALETIGKGLRELHVKPGDVVISNKLAWVRVPLKGPEPTFEPGVWVGLKDDAVQKISYKGILECWEQGCKLVGEPYRPQLAAVHDPDEYLAAAKSEAERQARLNDILDACQALTELKKKGEVKAVGVGAKDWKAIRELAEAVDFDWVMLACSLTIMHHPPELLSFVESLKERGVGIINSAVFHAGFLTGGAFFDYRRLNADNPKDQPLFQWREKFFAVCKEHGVAPALACVQFAMTPPGVVSIALNTTKPERVKQNVELVQNKVPAKFWTTMKDVGLIARDYPYAG
jgi:D-threo-aldose 1-dehydrogenase